MHDQIKISKILVGLWFGILIAVFSIGAIGTAQSTPDEIQNDQLSPAQIDTAAKNDFVVETYHWQYIIVGIVIAFIATGGLRYLAVKEESHESPDKLGNTTNASHIFLPTFGRSLPTPNHIQSYPASPKKIKKHNNGII